MMVSILSVNVSSSEHMRTFAELLIINDDPSDSNPNCSEDSTLEESMWHTRSFENLNKMGLFLVWYLGGFFIALHLILLGFYSPHWLYIFVFQSQLLAPLVN